MNTFKNTLKLFNLDRQIQKKSPKTISRNSFSIKKLADFALSQDIENIEEVDRNLVRAFYAHCDNKGMKSSTVNGIHRDLKVFFTWCIDEGLIVVSPMEKIKGPKVPTEIKPPMSKDEFGRLVAACGSGNSLSTTRNLAIVHLLLDSGLRMFEFSNLTWGDIELGENQIFIRNGKMGKSGIAFFSDKSKKFLVRYRYFLEQSMKIDDETPVWHGKSGQLTHHGLRQTIKRLCKRAGVKEVTPHTFRRTLAVESLRNGASIYEVQQLTRHASINSLKPYLALNSTDASKTHVKVSPVTNW